MKVWTQIVGAGLLAGVTYVALLRIAEAKNETLAGGGVYALEERRRDELAAFESLRSGLGGMGEQAFADRLERLRRQGDIWIAPQLEADRWAIFVESLRLVRRIYIRRIALLDPRRHLYPVPPPDVGDAEQRAFAWISLAGALRHEVAHHDGVLEEAGAYAIEIAWYEGLRGSPWFASLGGEERRIWEWARESAVLSAQKAAAKAARMPGQGARLPGSATARQRAAVRSRSQVTRSVDTPRVPRIRRRVTT